MGRKSWKMEILDRIKSDKICSLKKDDFGDWHIMKGGDDIGSIEFNDLNKTAELHIFLEYKKSIRIGSGIGFFSKMFLDIIYKDKELKHFWDMRKLFLMDLQKGKCWSCEKNFDEKEKKFLHHYNMEFIKKDVKKKLNEITGKMLNGEITLTQGIFNHQDLFNKIFKYYSSTKDTALVCYDCHKQIDKI